MLFPDEALELLREARHSPEARQLYDELPGAIRIRELSATIGVMLHQHLMI
jgi:hypothetical protein